SSAVQTTSAQPAEVTVSESVAELLAEFGSPTDGVATVAVFERVPAACAEMVHMAVNVTEPPAGSMATSLMLPLPDAVQSPPPAPEQVQSQVSEAGKLSATVAFVTALGPELLAVMV